MAFNPTFNDIVRAYADNKRAKNSTTGESYENYQLATITLGEITTQIDGKVGGNTFVSDDKSVTATTNPPIRGFGYDGTLLKTSDGQIVLFY